MVFEINLAGLKFKSCKHANQTILDVFDLNGSYIGKLSFIFSKSEKTELREVLKDATM